MYISLDTAFIKVTVNVNSPSSSSSGTDTSAIVNSGFMSSSTIVTGMDRVLPPPWNRTPDAGVKSDNTIVNVSSSSVAAEASSKICTRSVVLDEPMAMVVSVPLPAT